MRIPRMEITQQRIQLDIKTIPAEQRIEQHPADLQIEQPAAILEISTTKPTLDINLDQFWADLGFKKTGVLVEEYANRGLEEVMNGIARRAQEGRKLMLSAGKGQGAQTIQSIAKENYGPKRPGPINIKFIPSYQSVKIQYDPGNVDIQVQTQKPKINVAIQKPVHEYTKGKTQIDVLQYPSLKIDWTI
ncbi:DUF6470 family protein [Solibacillus silvestris]